jgi:hypothetical protein
MATKRTPPQVNDLLRPKFGLGNILAQSEIVAAAFGPERGYRLMILVVASRLIIGVGTTTLVAWSGRYLVGH